MLFSEVKIWSTQEQTNIFKNNNKFKQNQFGLHYNVTNMIHSIQGRHLSSMAAEVYQNDLKNLPFG